MTQELTNIVNSSSSYWEKRALQNKVNIIDNEDDYLERLEKVYVEAENQIADKMARVYQTYADVNGMTLKQAYKVLPKDIEQKYVDDVYDYIAKASSGNPIWRDYLTNQSLMHKHTVLDKLRTEYRNIIQNIDKENTSGKFLDKMYKNAFYFAQYSDAISIKEKEIKEQPFAMVDQAKINNLLKENWSGGGSFSENIWKNKELLVNSLDDIVMKGLAVGDSFEKMSKQLAKKMDTSFNNAKRLIVTESARMDNEGLLDYYKGTNVKQVTFVATLDNKTSEICRAMDGEIFNIEDAKLGLNVPPLHPHCRSVISPYYDFNEVNERIYKDAQGKTQTGENMTYAQYVEKKIGNPQEAAFIISNKNALKDLVRAINITPTNTISNMGISPSQELIEKNRFDQGEFKNYFRDSIENRDIELEVEENLKKLIEDGELATRVSMEAMSKILDEGRIKSQFETKVSSTGVNEALRKDVEKQLFGYDRELNPALRPVYGYLTNTKDGFEFSSSNGAVMYGNVSVILSKNSLAKNTTFTVGDSLDGTRWSYKVPSQITKPNISAVSLERSLTRENNFTLGTSIKQATKNVPYIEIQVHGGVSTKDIEKVFINTSYETWQGKQDLNINPNDIKALTKKLDKLNIKYEVK